MASAELSIAVEPVVHKLVRELFDRVAAEHGLRITHIDASWLDCSSVSEPCQIVDGLTVEMKG